MKKRICIFTILPLIFVLAFSYAYSRENETASDDTMKTADQPVKQLQMSEAKAESLLQKRAEIFEEMGWIEGEYANEKEAEIAEALKIYSDKGTLSEMDRMNFSSSSIWRKGEKEDYLRPLGEIVLDPYCALSLRVIALGRLQNCPDKKSSLKLIQPFLDHELPDIKNTHIRLGVTSILYRLGDKQRAFEMYEQIIKEGHVFSNKYFNFEGDMEAKPFLFRVLECDNPEMQALTIYTLIRLGERERIQTKLDELLGKLDRGEIDLKKHRSINTYLGWIERRIEEGKNEN